MRNPLIAWDRAKTALAADPDDDALVRAEQIAYDEWSDYADEHGYCVSCGTALDPDSRDARCDEHRVRERMEAGSDG